LHMQGKRPYGRRPPPRGPKTSCEGVARWYGKHMEKEDTVQDAVVLPGAERLLSPAPGKRYLDIACGEGSFMRLIAKRQGVRVAGFDASPTLVERAKKLFPRGEYAVADARKFAGKYQPASFDGAACLLAIQNIDEIGPVFADAAKVLKPGARFVVVMNHPAFRQLRQSGWGWDENRKLQYRRVDKYLTPFEVPIQAHPGSAPGLKTFSYHRPLQAYAAELTKHGFAIDALEEWSSHRQSDSGPRAKAENVARQEIPMFLAIRAIKK
jgi:ubiquinone/menaquinone biosynthesis C-methylase UbiE